MKNQTVDGNATVDLEKLADRKTENDSKTEKGNVTSIDNLRQKRLKEKQNLFNVPLVDRNPLRIQVRKLLQQWNGPKWEMQNSLIVQRVNEISI